MIKKSLTKSMKRIYVETKNSKLKIKEYKKWKCTIA